MNKTVKRALTLALALVMCLAMAAPAMALGTSNGASATVPVDKTLSMSETAVAADATFTFALAAADGTTADGTLTTSGDDNYMVYAGIVQGVTYTAAAAGSNIGAGDLSGSNGSAALKFNADDAYSGTGIKSLAKHFNIDFSGVDYKAPGVYRYKFTESAAEGYETDGTVYYIDVYVEYENGTATTPTIGKIVVTKDTQGTIGAGTGKVDSISLNNSKQTYDLTLTKNVSGNQGSRNKEFTFTVTVENVTSGTYNYTGSKTGSITVPAGSTTGTATITLKHNETITIQDLPAGAMWAIVETDYSGDGYSTTVEVTGTDAAQDDNTRTAKNDTGMSDDNAATFTNTRSGVVPTGVLLTVAPFVALMFIGLVGVAVILRKKHN